MLLVHGTVQFVPRTIREYQISYRPIRTHLADGMLILRLLFSRKAAEAPALKKTATAALQGSARVFAEEFVTRTEHSNPPALVSVR